MPAWISRRSDESALALPEIDLDSGFFDNGGRTMGLTRSLNVLLICAAFGFVGAMIVGLIH